MVFCVVRAGEGAGVGFMQHIHMVQHIQVLDPAAVNAAGGQGQLQAAAAHAKLAAACDVMV